MTADSKEIADGVAGGLKASRVGLTDRRLLIIFVLLAVTCIALFGILRYQDDQQNARYQRTVRASILNCETINAGNAKVNEIIAQLAKNAQNSTGLTPIQKATAAATYRSIQLPIVKDCTTLAGR